jgi:hypothetical protein
MLPKPHRLAGPFLAAVLLAGAETAAAQGLIYVLESTATAIRVGTAYGMTDRIDIPAGASVRMVMPSGKTQTIKGPYAGPVSDLAKGDKPNDGVMAWIRNLLQTGGSNERTPGVTRSIRAAPPPARFSWTAIPVDIDSTICVQKGARLELRRRSLQGLEQITIADEAGTQRGVAEFATGRDSAPWPEAIPVRADTRYVLGHNSGTSRRVMLRVLDSLPAEADILPELAARNCKYQFDAWVREKTGGRTSR